MNELKYLIYQSLINQDLNVRKKEIFQNVKNDLDKEHISYDSQMIDTLIEICVDEIENSIE